jgi:pSer/pThr/pTyr-binding forkhead associated (FHA) protein
LGLENDCEKVKSLDVKLDVMVMSGVDDGLVLNFSAVNGDGQLTDDKWVISIGRREDSDMCVRNDTFVSRQHAFLHLENGGWWLEDCHSRNGTFVEEADQDAAVQGVVPLNRGQLFRVGRTWLRIQE